LTGKNHNAEQLPGLLFIPDDDGFARQYGVLAGVKSMPEDSTYRC
jgi:hypothetical protein